MLEIELFENLWEANLDPETTSNTRLSFPTPPCMGIHFFSISHSVKSVHQVDRATEAKWVIVNNCRHYDHRGCRCLFGNCQWGWSLSTTNGGLIRRSHAKLLQSRERLPKSTQIIKLGSWDSLIKHCQMYFLGIEVLNLMECFNSTIYICSKFTFFITQSYQYLEKKNLQPIVNCRT